MAGVTECKACINSSECVYCNAAFYDKKPDYCLCNQSQVCKDDFDTLENMAGCKLEPIPPEILEWLLLLCLSMVCSCPKCLYETCATFRPPQRFEFEMTYIAEPQAFTQDNGSTTSNEEQYQDEAQTIDRGRGSEHANIALV